MSEDDSLPRNTLPRLKRVRHWLDLFIYLSPVSLIVLLFVFAPLAIILFFSFLQTGIYGEIIYSFTLENIRSVLTGGYGRVFYQSIVLAFQTNILCILIGYPLAYFIARYGGRWKTTLVFLIIVPSWASYLIRLYALKTIAGNNGFINNLLMHFQLISSPIEMLYTPYAVMVGLVYAWIPYMILPIYASLEGMDKTVLEAASDLGATPFRRFFRVTLPLSRGGLLAGSILVFIPTVGEWLVPHVLGGSKVMMAGNLVAQQFIEAGNIPAGASLAIMLAATLVLILYLVIKFGGRESLERMV